MNRDLRPLLPLPLLCPVQYHAGNTVELLLEEQESPVLPLPQFEGEEAGDDAGYVPRLHSHAFRHFVATTLLNEGIDIKGVQEHLGHLSIRSTEAYAHPDKTKMSQRNADALSKFYGEKLTENISAGTLRVDVFGRGEGIRTDGFESRKKVSRRRILQGGLIPQEALRALIQGWEVRFPLREIPESLGELLEVLE